MAPGGSVDHLVSDRVVRAHDLGGPFTAGLKGRALAVMSEDACRQHAKGHPLVGAPGAMGRGLCYQWGAVLRVDSVGYLTTPIAVFAFGNRGVFGRGWRGCL